MKVQPTEDRVVIIKEEAAEDTSSLIHLLPGSVAKPNLGIITAVGPGRKLDNGDVIEMTLAVGDRVLFSENAAKNGDVVLSGMALTIMRQGDVIAVVNK